MQISQCAIDVVYEDGMVCRRRGMKNAVLAVAVTAGVGGFAFSSYAQEVKKLPDHPRRRRRQRRRETKDRRRGCSRRRVSSSIEAA
jgi:hypothetical protein